MFPVMSDLTGEKATPMPSVVYVSCFADPQDFLPRLKLTEKRRQ